MNKIINWTDVVYLDECMSNPLIEVGHHSYYSAYYENDNFENGCVRYLWGHKSTKSLFNPIESFGWKLDKLIIGNYVCIASGAIILMGGNHNHNSDWITVYPFESHLKDSLRPKGIRLLRAMPGSV